MKIYLEDTVWRQSSGAAWTTQLEAKAKMVEAELIRSENEKQNCDHYLYVVTPNMTGVSTIIDAVNDSNHASGKTIFCVLDEEDGKRFTKHQNKSLVATGKMIRTNGGKWFENMDDALAGIFGN